jgi:hypothetical protein
MPLISFISEAKERQQDVTHTLRSDCILCPATGVQKILSDCKIYEQMPELDRSNIFKQSDLEMNKI